MKNINKIVKLLRRAFKPHDWALDEMAGTRTCTTCGCAEQYVLDDPTNYWDVTSAGDKSKHV